MFDQQKVLELENKSHVRGRLNKQFYSNEQEELQRKRRQMKAILDQQVQDRRRKKQQDRYQQDMKIRKQEDQIKAYYAQIEDREKRVIPGINNSNVAHKQSNVYAAPKNNGLPSSRFVNGIHDSRASFPEGDRPERGSDKNSNKNRSNSRKQLIDASDIPVMPVMQASSSSFQKNKALVNHSQPYHYQNNNNNQYHRSSAGNIPLLQLSQDERSQIKMKNERKRSKNKKSDHLHVDPQEYKERKRRPTVQEEESLPGSRQHTEFKEVFGDLNEELENQNRQLKNQLKKNQEAISLLIGAVRSNAKLDKFRVQAEKILHGQNTFQYRNNPNTHSRARKLSTRAGQKQKQKEKQKQKQKQKQILLPKLKLKHQSIMHDYLFGSAKKGYAIKAKTMK